MNGEFMWAFPNPCRSSGSNTEGINMVENNLIRAKEEGENRRRRLIPF
jgi:hypothetical protein